MYINSDYFFWECFIEQLKKRKGHSLRLKMIITLAVLITVGMFSIIIFDYVKNSAYSERLLSKEAQKITQTITARTNDWLMGNKNAI